MVSAQARQIQSCNCLIPQEHVRAEKEEENSQVWDGLHRSSKEDSGGISGEGTEVMAPRHLPQGYLAGRDL